jgi:hypothetical protein
MRVSSRLALLLTAGLVLGTTAPALAQFMPSDIPGAGRIATGQQSGGAKQAPSVPEPASVPGNVARAPAAPPTKTSAEMSPNDALFDAINRGDIAAARDALDRGADLSARNVLGMTPMELSVDLGRNDISFLLLSMRAEDDGTSPDAAPAHGGQVFAQSGNTPSGTMPSGKMHAGKTARAGRATRAAHPAKPMTVATTTPISAPKLFANNGGTPVPSAGFLGFATR